MTIYNKKIDLKEIMNIIKEMPDQKIKKDLTKFLPLNQRATVEKVKFWLIEKLEKYLPKS